MMSRTANPRQAELQMAKEILAEIFRVRPGEVEEIGRGEPDWRAEGSSTPVARNIWSWRVGRHGAEFREREDGCQGDIE